MTKTPSKPSSSRRGGADTPWYIKYVKWEGAFGAIIAATIGACAILASKSDDKPTTHAENRSEVKAEISPKMEQHTQIGLDEAKTREMLHSELGPLSTKIDALAQELAGKQEPTPGDSAQKRNAIELFNRGQDAAMKADWSACVAYNDSVLLLDPQFAAAYNARGLAKGRLGRYEDAINDCHEAIRIDPNNAKAYVTRGIAKDLLGRHDDAINDCDEAIRLDPNEAKAYNHRGEAKRKLGRCEDAIKDYDEAIRINPNNAKAYNNRGNAKEELGRHEDAIKDYDEAIRLNSNYAIAYYNRANAKFAKHDVKGASEDHKKALQIEPSLPR